MKLAAVLVTTDMDHKKK